MDSHAIEFVAAAVILSILCFVAFQSAGRFLNGPLSKTGQWLRLRLNGVKLPHLSERVLMALLVGLFMLGHAAVTHAVTATPTPAPTATPIPVLDIPTGVIFEQTNNWMQTFAPIAAIGIGIGIALAVLGYLGKMIKGAFN